MQCVTFEIHHFTQHHALEIHPDCSGINACVCVCVCVCVCEVTSVVSDSVTPWTSPPGSSVHGILQARILEWVAMPSSRGSSPPRDQTQVSYISCIGRWFFTTNATWEALGISGSFLFITELYSMAWMNVL